MTSKVGVSGDTTPCRMTGVALHSHVHHTEIQARTCSGPLFSSVKPYSHTISLRSSYMRLHPQKVKLADFGVCRVIIFSRKLNMFFIFNVFSHVSRTPVDLPRVSTC